MAELFDGKAVEYDGFKSMLPQIDIVIASSGAPHYILDREDMERTLAARKNEPVFLIDIAVPRNIDPAVHDVDGAFLYNVDDLARVVEANIQERVKQAEQAEAIVVEELDRMMARLKLEEVTPTIVSLQDWLENIRANEVARTIRRIPGITPEQQQMIEAMTKAIVNKIAHGPISELRRNAGQPEGEQVIDAIRKVFHL